MRVSARIEGIGSSHAVADRIERLKRDIAAQRAVVVRSDLATENANDRNPIATLQPSP